MIFRKATLTDVPSLVFLRGQQLLEECLKDQKIHGEITEEINKQLTEYFTNALTEDTLVVWVAETDNHIIATSGVCFFHYPPTLGNPAGKIAYITDVYTVPMYRRQGIATKLLDDTMGEIKERGCLVARLHASSEGKKLYEKAGFHEAEGFMVWRNS